MRTWKTSSQYYLMAILAAFGLVVLTSSDLVAQDRELLQSRMEHNRQIVEAAHSVIAHYGRQESEGHMTREQAQAGARDEMKRFHNGAGDYVWINDYEATIVLLPVKPRLEGKNLAEFIDLAGKKMFSEFIRVVKADGAGFVDYLWPRPGYDEPAIKIAYVKGYEPWKWVVGRAIYLDDDAAVNRGK